MTMRVVFCGVSVTQIKQHGVDEAEITCACVHGSIRTHRPGIYTCVNYPLVKPIFAVASATWYSTMQNPYSPLTIQLYINVNNYVYSHYRVKATLTIKFVIQKGNHYFLKVKRKPSILLVEFNLVF